MHYEFIVEDISGSEFIKNIIGKIIDAEANSFRIHTYRGIGRIPKKLNETNHPRQRHLLTQLPKLLNGLGKTFLGYGEEYPACIVVVCDLDAKDLREFLNELQDVLASCHTAPTTRFCIAIEESEAWLLGDVAAIKFAYPKAKDAILSSYSQDSICGTWELLADAIYPGGKSSLRNFQEIGRAKFDWANNITPLMDINRNESPSFQHFVKNVQELAEL